MASVHPSTVFHHLTPSAAAASLGLKCITETRSALKRNCDNGHTVPYARYQGATSLAWRLASASGCPDCVGWQDDWRGEIFLVAGQMTVATRDATVI